jgi:hypothetical protein
MPVLARSLLFVSLLLAQPATAEELLGQVVGISDGDTLTLLTQDHRQVRRGLWALPISEQVPPWDWRQNGRSAPTSSLPPVSAPSRPLSPPQASSGSGMSCGSKRYCTQMTSCAEAQFHFRQCGLVRLDGDRDGVPCEQLCR